MNSPYLEFPLSSGSIPVVVDYSPDGRNLLVASGQTRIGHETECVIIDLEKFPK
jgi:hypothetical protein